MKRIKAACLEQTLHFTLNDRLPASQMEQETRREFDRYIAQLEHSRTKYQIVENTVQPDGSLIVKIRKQYINHDVGAYFN